MARPVVLSNGSVFIGLNENGLLDDIYFPYVGLENLKTARLVPHKIGVYVDNKTFSWVDDGKWQIDVSYEHNAMIASTRMQHKKLGIELEFTDAVDAHEDAFLRHIKIHNKTDQHKSVKLFMHQVFQLSRDGRADTAFFVPEDNYIFDYKGHTAIIIASLHESKPFSEFAVGNYSIEGKSGTYMDAEDGNLSGNLVEHGGVDSVIAHTIELSPQETKDVDYWLALGKNQQETGRVHEIIMHESVPTRIAKTRTYWVDWLQTAHDRLPENLDPFLREMTIKSTLIVKAHIDKNGAIIASGDSSLYNYGRDYYAYCWPRDGAYAIWPLIKLGYHQEARNFFNFCIRVMHTDGYMQHKYQADGAYGSTWHPLMQDHHKELAIQEDETAIVLYMLAEYVEQYNDIEYFKQVYRSLVQPAADFLANYVDDSTGLPHPSYDLWEEKFISSTYTNFLVSCTLRRIAKVANEILEDNTVGRWVAAAERIDGNLNKLFDQDKQYFIKGLKPKSDGIDYDTTLDMSSAYAVFMFGGQVRDSFALAQTIAAIENQLMNGIPAGGTPRYNDDYYLRSSPESPGNPWFICTLWLIQYYHYVQNVDRRDELLTWVNSHIASSGMMSEQIDAKKGSQTGVAPLVWSHAEYINTILDMYGN